MTLRSRLPFNDDTETPVGDAEETSERNAEDIPGGTTDTPETGGVDRDEGHQSTPEPAIDSRGSPPQGVPDPSPQAPEPRDAEQTPTEQDTADSQTGDESTEHSDSSARSDNEEDTVPSPNFLSRVVERVHTLISKDRSDAADDHEDHITSVGSTAGVDGSSGSTLQVSPDIQDLVDKETHSPQVQYEDLETGPDGELPPIVGNGEFDITDYLNRIENLHQRQIAAPEIKQTDTSARVGQLHRRVMLAHEWPDNTQLAGLKGALDDPDLHLDMTVHFQARDRDASVRKAQSLFDSLDASAELSNEDGDQITAGDKARRKQKTRQFLAQMKERDEQPVSASMYVSARADDRETLRNNVDAIRETFRSDAGIKLKTLERKQLKALKSIAPTGADPLRHDPHVDPTKQVLGRSVGAVGASFTRSKKFDPEGHEWGLHSAQGHPIVKDPFKTTRNYNLICVGESGTGKSLNMKQLALATKAVHPDTMIVMLDPLNGFRGIAEALDAKVITIGGQQALNPMEIRKPSEEHINSEAFSQDQDPLSARVDDVMSFIVNYTASQPGLKIGEESQLLRALIMQAYRQNGITRDINTHNKESPTLRDVLMLAGHARKNPEKYASDFEATENIERYASRIGNLLREFYEEGQYEHLGTSSQEDLFGDADVIYLDLSQQESSGGSDFGVLGQLLFSLAYERCKEYHGPAMYIVDEARYMFREAKTLEFLAQGVRHSRHFNTSIRFITQEMDDFFEFEQAEGIVNNSSFKVIHQSADVDDWGDKFDLNERHKAFVKNCATGEEHDYSQALVQFPEDDRWYPVTIALGEMMLQIADFNEREDSLEDLPGKGTVEQSKMVRELRARLRRRETSHHEAVNTLLAEWEQPLWEMLSAEDIEQCLNRIEAGEHPRNVFYGEALTRIRWTLSQVTDDQVASEILDRVEDGLHTRLNSDGASKEPAMDSPVRSSAFADGKELPAHQE